MKILIVKTSSLGDLIHAFPAIAFIKSKYPDAKIDWVVEKSCAALIQAHPQVNRTITIDTRNWRKISTFYQAPSEIFAFCKDLRNDEYDVLFDLQGNVKSGLITWMAKSPIKVGFTSKFVSEWPNVLATNQKFSLPPNNIRGDYLHLAQSHFDDFSPFEFQGMTLKLTEIEESQIKKHLPLSPFIVVCPGSHWKNKQLPEEALLDFLYRLENHFQCPFAFVSGSEPELSYANRLKSHFTSSTIIDRASLAVLQNIMSKASLVVAMDSLPLHLAGTTQTTTFSVFGASLAEKFKPVGKNHHSFQGSCPYGRQFKKRCPILRSCKTGSCIRSLSGETLFRSFMEQMAKNKETAQA